MVINDAHLTHDVGIGPSDVSVYVTKWCPGEHVKREVFDENRLRVVRMEFLVLKTSLFPYVYACMYNST